MARPAILALPSEALPLAGNVLDDDRIDFDAWLLPPEPLGRIEQGTRLCSAAAGPILFAAAFACVVTWIV